MHAVQCMLTSCRAYKAFIPVQIFSILQEHPVLTVLPERPLMIDRRRRGFHGDPILIEEGPFCSNVSRAASSLRL